MAVPLTAHEKYFGQAFLGDIAEWIGSDLDLDQVFDKDYIAEWARGNLEPGEIFSDGVLEDWALENGYTKGE